MNGKMRYLMLLLSTMFLLLCYYSGKKLKRKLKPAPSQLPSFLSLQDLHQLQSSTAAEPPKLSKQLSASCRMETCFNFSRCHDKFSVYLYPYDEGLVPSDSYLKILNAVSESAYYTAEADEACLFILSLDTLDRDVLSQDFVRNMQSRVESLPTWQGGQNHLIFNLYSGTWPDYTEDIGFDIGKAMLAKASIANENYRPGFDISLPLFHRSHPDKGGEAGYLTGSQFPVKNQYFMAFKGKRYVHGIGSETRNSLYHLHNGRDAAVVTTCKHGKNWRDMQDDRCEADNAEYEHWDYVSLLANSTFCLVPRGRRLGSFRFLETLQAGCIPVILSNGWQLPFGEVLDWTAATITVDERQLLQVPEILHSLPAGEVFRMRQQTQLMWDLYLSSVRKIVHTTLEIIRQRVFSHLTVPSHIWNSSPGVFYAAPEQQFDAIEERGSSHAARLDKFTAIVFTKSDPPVTNFKSRIFHVLRSISGSGSVEEVVVVWQSNATAPPLPDWYQLTGLPARVPLRILRSADYNITHRIQWAGIAASATVLLLNEDVPLRSDEIRFALAVFLEFPDQLVGFSARSHRWEPERGLWRYSSRPATHFSMIETTAAFIHRKYADIHQTQLPRRALKLARELPHCQDILLNMLIAQATRRPPIKVTQRMQHQQETGKIKPQTAVVKQERLAVESHQLLSSVDQLEEFQDRQVCLNSFAKELGSMPLLISELRLDPVLFKDPVSNLRKKYRKMELPK